ncbi:MAG: Arc family DNA-binding protein [Candidatus Azotimanducaceae bacterium]
MSEVEHAKFVLRLSPNLHKKIKRRAKVNNTSMNKEITNILSDSFSNTTTDKKLTDLIARLEKKRII